jgi:hypothetical protein
MSIKDNLIREVDLFLMKPLLVAKYQGVIRRNLLLALEGQPAGPNAIANLIAAVHHGDIQAWVGVAGEEGNRKMVGMVFTTVATDYFLGTSRLVVYGLNAEARVSPDAFAKGLNTLVEYAKKRGCRTMVAQTSVRGIRKVLEGNGWTNGQCVLTKDL